MNETHAQRNNAPTQETSQKGGHPFIAEEVVSEVKKIWQNWGLYDPKRSGSPPKATDVHRLYHNQDRAKEISLRKVQGLIREWKSVQQEADGPTLKELYRMREKWWPSMVEPDGLFASKSAETIDALLTMHGASMALFNRTLFVIEAKWVERLRVALASASTGLQLLFIREYAERELAAQAIGSDEAYLEDLNVILSFKPWIPGNDKAYELAVHLNKVAVPLSSQFQEFLRIRRGGMSDLEIPNPYWLDTWISMVAMHRPDDDDLFPRTPWRIFLNYQLITTFKESRFLTDEGYRQFMLSQDEVAEGKPDQGEWRDDLHQLFERWLNHVVANKNKEFEDERRKKLLNKQESESEAETK